MKDALTDINERVAPSGIEVLDIHSFAQVHCRCGVIYTLDLAQPHKCCDCGIHAELRVAFIVLVES